MKKEKKYFLSIFIDTYFLIKYNKSIMFPYK